MVGYLQASLRIWVESNEKQHQLVVKTGLEPRAPEFKSGALNTHPRCFLQFIMWGQEIIKVREWIPHMCPLTKVIPLKLFPDIFRRYYPQQCNGMHGTDGASFFYRFVVVKKYDWPLCFAFVYYSIPFPISPTFLHTRFHSTWRLPHNPVIKC